MSNEFNLKDEFIERNEISDFLRENRMNSELLNIVVKHRGETRLTDRDMTRIFNNAYRICTIATHRNGTMTYFRQFIKRLQNTKMDIESVSLVAWCLLRLHNGLIPVSDDIVSWLYDRCRQLHVYSYCMNFVRNYAGDFDKPINFSGRAIVIKTDSDMPDVEEEFMKNHSLFLESIQQILRNNQELRQAMAQMEEKHAKELEEWRTKEQTLRIRIETYNKALREQQEYIRVLEHDLKEQAFNPRTIIREVEKKVPVETPKSKVFSPESLVKYAITLPKDEDADFLATVMRDICFRERFVDDDVFKLIESIQTERDEAREKMKKKQEQKPSITYNINSVGQLNPVAEKVENNYERLSVGSQFDDILTTKAEVGEELPYSEIIKKTSSLIKKLTDLDISDDERRNEESN